MSRRRGAGIAAARFPQIASRLFDVPHLVEQRRLETIINVLSGRMGIVSLNGEEISRAKIMEDDESGPSARELAMQARGMQLAQQTGAEVEPQDEGHYLVGNVAVIPILGTLIQRGDWISSMSGMVGYDTIAEQLQAALNDPRVDKILLEVDSPGGEAAGAFDLSDLIYNARGQKPIVGVSNELSASGGYLILSAADEVVIPRSGSQGSVGVVTSHVDWSEYLKKEGVAFTYLYAGDKKVDGNPTQPLNDRARADIQGDINTLYDLFVNTVARNRGMDASAVQKTQAGMYMGQKAVDVGFADRVGTFSDELNSLLMDDPDEPDDTVTQSPPGAGSRLSTPRQEIRMTKEIKKPGSASGPETTKPEASTQQTERTRIAGIINSEAAQGRTELADHLAFETDMSVEAAVAMLGKAPKAQAAAPAAPGKNALEQAMERNGSPDIRNDSGDIGKPETYQPPVLKDATLNAGEVYKRRTSAIDSGPARFTASQRRAH